MRLILKAATCWSVLNKVEKREIKEAAVHKILAVCQEPDLQTPTQALPEQGFC